MSLSEKLKKLRENGVRITKVRKSIIDILYRSKCCLNKVSLNKKLNQKKLYPNRSTIFREILFLIDNQIIQKTNILNTDYYSIHACHHHLICLSCKSIKKIELGKNHLVKKEREISLANNFEIKNHNLDFYGLCVKCK